MHFTERANSRSLTGVIGRLGLAAIFSFWSLGAHAQSASEGVQHSRDPALAQSGIAAFERHDYALALTVLQHAARIAPGPTVGLYLARSRVALGQLVEAAGTYRGVVEAVDPASQSAADKRAVAAARDELAQLRPRIPTIDVALGEPERRTHNLRVVLDGKQIGYGSPVLLNPGHHQVIASDTEDEKARVSFDVVEGESKTVGLSWHAEFAHGTRRQDALGSASAARKNWGIVALSVGATGLGVGTVTGIAALTRYSAAEQHCPANKCVEGTPYPEDGSAFRTLRTISAAGYVVGAGGIGTWLGLLLTTPTSKAEHPTVSPWTPVVGMGSAGARYAF